LASLFETGQGAAQDAGEPQELIKPLKSFRFLIILLTAAVASQAYAATWRSVQDKSELEFIANYEGADAAGQFDQFEVEISFGPVSLTPQSLQVNVDITSVSMGNADIDEAIAGTEWFDAQAFPRAVFHSEKISATDDQEYIAKGVISIKGVDQTISVPFHWQPEDRDAVLTGSLRLSRMDFGIGSGEWALDTSIGHDVQVHFRIALKAE
jgi:polyisoprenoid-binding protein YceI